MDRQQTIAVWTNFVVTMIKRKYCLSHAAFLKIMKQYKIIPFLVQNYELLHYYDNDYIIEDTMRYISKQGGKIP
ncbi:MAG: DUF3791 domain-containing protein [Chitinispirillales bacterium]|nr:DUF3791 domain-containing protein [Chitinispirillales bacterium]